MRYSIITFGCRVNQADSLGFEEQLAAEGGVSTAVSDADVIVVNTCSVTAAADQGARQTIRRAARDNPNARIIVTGCYATRRPDELSTLPNVACVVANDDKPQLMSFIRRVREVEVSTAERFGDGDGSCGARLEPGVAGRTAFTLRVQTGCAEPCSYCIIPTTRGAPRSTPVDEVLREVERVVAAGFKEIVLTGVHLGSYGRDLVPTSSLTTLLRRLARAQEWMVPRARESTLEREILERAGGGAPASGVINVLFRISSLEPMDCTPEIVDLVASSPVFAPHFHLPLQHASNRMLSAMRRPYTIGQYARLVDDIRVRMPNASIGSDIIVGFPGETEEDAKCLEQYLERSPLTHLHVFPYSDRPGTAASTLGGKVPGALVRDRGRRIREIGRVLTERFHASQLGAVHHALTLDDGSLVVTGNYLKLRIPAGCARNEWVRVRVVSHDHGELLGRGFALAFDDQLSAGGADVAAAALSDGHADPAFGDDLREPVDRGV
jgi:threonylcarbamoyladenosine tRNA methylthiotransferase MtaB